MCVYMCDIVYCYEFLCLCGLPAIVIVFYSMYFLLCLKIITHRSQLLLTAHMDAASTSQDGSTEPPSKRRKAPPPPATAPPAVGGGAGAGARARAGPARSTVQKKEVTQSTPDLHLLSELGKSLSGLRFQAPAAQQYLCQQTQQSSAQQPFFHVYAIPVT